MNTQIIDKVSIILESYPDSRNSDRKLCLYYLKEFHELKKIIDVSGYMGLVKVFLNPSTPTMESLSRARRRIQEKGFYLSDKQVKQNRQDKEKEFRESKYY